MTEPTDTWAAEGVRVLRQEAEALLAMADRFDQAAFNRAVDIVFNAKAPVVVTGMGKSGHIARKVAATLASTGTAASYMHPGEALHGDLGMVPADSAVIAFSQSGTTDEILNILPYLSTHHIPIVAVTGGMDSPLGRAARAILDSSVREEACPLNLAPTTSTTAQLALGDALAIALMRRRGFRPEDFAIRHPLGTLGRRLLMRIADLMKKGADMPVVPLAATLHEAVDELNRKRLGCVAIVDEHGHLAGIFTDGDLRRLWAKTGTLETTMPVGEVMIRSPRRVSPDTLCVKAVDLMEEYKITVLPAVEEDGTLAGVIHLHDLIALGISR